MAVLLLSLAAVAHLFGINSAANFTVEPVSVVQAEGLEAVFECLYPRATAYSWSLNGTFLFDFPPGVVRTAPSEGSPARLIIPATPQYDNTVVHCEAVVREGGGLMSMLSENASLQVQGPLSPITNLHFRFEQSTNTTITISWTPPFSLNLTTAEPDIQYCVDVYNVTGGEADLLESVCDITNVIYSFTPSDPSCRELYNFTVTPRSNVEGSLNGTTSNSVQGGPSLFTINPMPVIQATGIEAAFECLHPGAILPYSWIVGGSIVNSTASPSTDFPAKLTIPAISEYNNTVVECRVVVEQEGNFRAFSCPAILIVQGSLMAVRNLGVESDQTTITISWTPPFSLNLTTAEPDIQYCVDVYNEVDELVESQCDITDTLYTFSASDPDLLFNFTVTPRSNVEGSLNGTTSQPVQGYIVKDTLLPDSTSPSTGIIAGVVLIFLLILILSVVVVPLVITLRRKQGEVSMQSQAISTDGRVDWSTAFTGIEQPNEAFSTVMNRNIAYEQTKKPRRQRKRKRQQQPLTPAPEESTHTAVVQYENVTGLQEDHLYEEALLKGTVPVESTVDEVVIGRKETERVHYENTEVAQCKQKYENVCAPTGGVPHKPYVNVVILD